MGSRSSANKLHHNQVEFCYLLHWWMITDAKRLRCVCDFRNQVVSWVMRHEVVMSTSKVCAFYLVQCPVHQQLNFMPEIYEDEKENELRKECQLVTHRFPS